MKKVLIVEDDPTWAGILGRYVEQLGASSTAVNSPQAAMNALDEQLPDVILLDILLATETGMALLNEMRGYDDLANVPVVVCSSVDGVGLEYLAPFGVRAVLDKVTMQPDDVKNTIKGILNAG